MRPRGPGNEDESVGDVFRGVGNNVYIGLWKRMLI